VLGDTNASCRSHLLDYFFRVLIQKLIHRLADDIVPVQLIRYAESSSIEAEVDQQSTDP